MVSSSEQRFLLLFTFLKKNLKKKVAKILYFFVFIISLHVHVSKIAYSKCLLSYPALTHGFVSYQVMVFFSSCNSVKFHSELLNYIDIQVMDIHVSYQ